MGADAAKLPPFRKLPFKAPDMEVRRGEGGVVYLSSRTPLGPVPRSIPHVLDERAAEHPDRPWLKQREPNHGPWRTVTYGEGAKMTRSLALEFVRHRIRVNALAPGWFISEMNADYFARIEALFHDARAQPPFRQSATASFTAARGGTLSSSTI